ncbi:MAG: lactonase family protein [Clostridiales bacterium]|nr:lactonase family protein [Clostridiales bacterium]
MIRRPHYNNVYFAACAKVADGGGIYHCRVDGRNIELTKYYPLDRPMYIDIDDDTMYVLLREPFDGAANSGLVLCKINNDGSLGEWSVPISTAGRCACHLSVYSGNVYAVNYLSGNVVKMTADGVVQNDEHKGQGVHPTRQEAPHTHFVRESPDGKYVFAVDLGVDKIFTYTHELELVSTASVPAGEGCRHLEYHPNGQYVYCANELGSSVTVFKYSADGALNPLKTYTALPVDFDKESTIAAIRISPDGQYLYVSHRGHDSICVLDIACGGAVLRSPEWTKIAGTSPRDFDLLHYESGASLLFVTNERTNNVTVFSVDGKQIHKIDTEFAMPNPLCVKFF